MKVIIVADFPVNPKEDRDMVIYSLQEDIGDAGFNTDDVLDDGKSDPTFVISGDIPVSVDWKHLTRKDNLIVTTKGAIDATWLRQFVIKKIELDLRNV